MDIMEQLL
jgi:hypothetical protein